MLLNAMRSHAALARFESLKTPGCCGLRRARARTGYRTLRLEALEDRTLLATFNLFGGVPDGAPGSLRAAIAIANQNGEDDVVNLAAGIYGLSLSGSDDTNAKGDLDITEVGKMITIRGAGATATMIDAAISGDRAFHVLRGASAVLAGITVTGGNPLYANGGGILNDGRLTLMDVAVTGNRITDTSFLSSDGRGGGIHNTGTLDVRNSSVYQNNVTPTYGGWGWSKTWHNGKGGGISNAGTATIIQSTVTENSVGTNGYLPGMGGGIYNTGSLTAGENTIDHNVPDNLFNQGGTVTLLGRPSAADDEYTVNEGETLAVGAPGVLNNDSDPNDDPLTAWLVENPSNGSVILGANGSFDYTPRANFNGIDSFTYQASDGKSDSNPATVTIHVSPVNVAPSAANDMYFVGPNDTLNVAAPGVLSNDSDRDGNLLTAVQKSNPVHGTLMFRSDGGFSYNPRAGFVGSDSFTYQAHDGLIDSNVATVTIHVATITVSTMADEDDGFLGGGNGISLREAVRYAPSGAVVDLPAGRYLLTRRGGNENSGVTGDLDVARNFTLRGASAATTIIDAGPLAHVLNSGILTGDRAFHILPGVTASISGVTISGGRADVSSDPYGGGAVLNEGVLTISESVLRDNHTVGFPLVFSGTNPLGEPRPLQGGAIYNTGEVAVTGSTIRDNDVRERYRYYCGWGCSALGERIGGEAGGVWSSGILTLMDSEVMGNKSGDGGAIHITPTGSAVLTRATISGNSAGLPGSRSGFGGGVTTHGNTTIVDSTFADNEASTFGGGIWLQADARATITGSTFMRNTAGELGGAIHLENGASLNMINSTISGNSATYFGGGITNRNAGDGKLNLTHVTVTENWANQGGGLYLEMASIVVNNTIVANNTSTSGGDDISGGFDVGLVKARFSLIEDARNTFFVAGSKGNVTGVDPRLGPLQDNGGPTLTHELLTDSPAIDAGSNKLAVDTNGVPLAGDQRGSSRLVDHGDVAGNKVDMGAVEMGSVVTGAGAQSSYLPTFSATSRRYRASTTFSETASDASQLPRTPIVLGVNAAPAKGFTGLGPRVFHHDDSERRYGAIDSLLEDYSVMGATSFSTALLLAR